MCEWKIAYDKYLQLINSLQSGKSERGSLKWECERVTVGKKKNSRHWYSVGGFV